MNLITYDFETYYDKDYSLSKLTTEEYVRNPLFEAIGIAVQVNQDPVQWFSGTKQDTAVWLREFDWANSMAVAHNAVFDAAILNWHFGIQPKHIADTLSMARAVHGTEVGGSLKVLAEHYQLGVKGTEVVAALGKRRGDFSDEDLGRYGEYCKNDVALTFDLFLCLSGAFDKSEMRLIDLTIRMFTEPKLVLHSVDLISHLNSIKETKSQLLDTVGLSKEDLMSNLKLADALRLMGVKPPMKISPTTGKETYAFAKTDEAFKALLDHEDPLVQMAVAARLGIKSTLEETRTQRFIDLASRGLMPVPLRYYAAHTGRWGGDDKINLQNIPRKSPLKKAMLAPPGYMIVDSDSSQIEARTLAWLAEQDDLVSAFAAGQDVYRIMASSIYSKEEALIDQGERFVGKTTILGCGYGMGWRKFQAQLKQYGVSMDDSEAEHVINVYRETYPEISKLWAAAQKAIAAMENDKTCDLGRAGVIEVHGKRGIRLPNGLFLKYPNLRKVANDEGRYEYVYDSKKGRQVIATKIYGGKLVENVCQALARCIIGEQLVNIADKHKVVLTVHDAIACVVPEHEVLTAQAYIENQMRIAPVWAAGLPLNCESGRGMSYGDC
jgi:DNA polymerase I-like protein with 3'-5' exonuclease and polymerase domains